MIYIFVSIGVPIFVYVFLPVGLEIFTHKRAPRNALLTIACLLYFVSWYLPSPPIHGEYTAFTTHMVGGGIFAGLIWLYLKQYFGWKASPLVELLSLYAFVSALGVTNELAELLMVERGMVELNMADTPFDLLANTVGALIFWIFYRLRPQK